jgi:hypothetical protein
VSRWEAGLARGIPLDYLALVWNDEAAGLDVKGRRIQMAMKGTKEERSILISHGTKRDDLAARWNHSLARKTCWNRVARNSHERALCHTLSGSAKFGVQSWYPHRLVVGRRRNRLVNDRKNSANQEVSATIPKLAP